MCYTLHFQHKAIIKLDSCSQVPLGFFSVCVCVCVCVCGRGGVGGGGSEQTKKITSSFAENTVKSICVHVLLFNNFNFWY
jgi:hypothetical protein